MSRLRPISHEERLSMVEHLDELRTRLIICVVALAVVFAGCFVENQKLINVLNRALPHASTPGGASHGLAQYQQQTARVAAGLRLVAKGATELAGSPHLSAADRAAAKEMYRGATDAAGALPKSAPVQEKPITIGVGEPFMTTLAVCAYFALLITLPLILYELYAFVIPALSDTERRIALPMMLAAPVLFTIGVVFAYFVVLPAAVHFLQGYNSSQFDILVQAKTYYTFEFFTMLGIGVAFQMPLALLGLQRAGIINGSTLTRNWRYATVGIAVVAAAMPGADPVTTAFETLPLVVLYLASIVLLRIADRRAAARAQAEADSEADSSPDPVSFG